MAVKETIAIVANASDRIIVVAKKLPLENFRILLVSKDSEKIIQSVDYINKKYPGAEIEVIDCVKNGCWEADIVVLYINEDEENDVAALIQEVATQKIVVNFLENNNCIESLQALLPHSKVVNVLDPLGIFDSFIIGGDDAAVATISQIFSMVH